MRHWGKRRRRAEPPPPNPYALPQPWRDLLSDVLRAQVKFSQTVAAQPETPLRTYLAALGQRVDEAVGESWQIGQRGAALTAAAARLDPGEIQRRLAVVEAQHPQPGLPADPGTVARTTETVQALRAQLDTVRRIQVLAEESRSRLQLLGARLGSAVAEAVELSVGPDDDGRVATVASDIDAVVAELGALRSAMTEAEAAAAGTPRPGG